MAVLRDGVELCGVRSHGLQELLLCYRLLQTLSVPRRQLSQAIPFTER